VPVGHQSGHGGEVGAFAALTAIIAGLALWTGRYAARLRGSARGAEGDARVMYSARNGNSVSR